MQQKPKYKGEIMAKKTYIVVFNEGGQEKRDEIEAASPQGMSRTFSAKMRKEKRKTGIKSYYLKV